MTDQLSFAEPAEPERPKQGTRTWQALRHMETYGAVCPQDVGWTSRLAARIHDLRQLGWDVESGVCGRHGHEANVAEYRLV